MITYKNISSAAKTFYGVKFAPGEIKSVPGYINNRGMVRIFGAKQASGTTKADEASTRQSTRGRKKKSNEPEKDSVAENTESIIEIQEETSNGNNG